MKKQGLKTKFFPNLIKVILGAIIILFCFVGCGSGNTYTVTKLNGETISITADDIISIKNNDEITFQNEYSRAPISGEGTITKIESGFIGSSTVGNTYYVVTINDEIRVETRGEVFSGIKVGDTVTFSGEIYSAFMYVDVDQATDSNSNPQQNIFLKN